MSTISPRLAELLFKYSSDLAFTDFRRNQADFRRDHKSYDEALKMQRHFPENIFSGIAIMEKKLLDGSEKLADAGNDELWAIHELLKVTRPDLALEFFNSMYRRDKLTDLERADTVASIHQALLATPTAGGSKQMEEKTANGELVYQLVGQSEKHNHHFKYRDTRGNDRSWPSDGNLAGMGTDAPNADCPFAPWLPADWTYPCFPIDTTPEKIRAWLKMAIDFAGPHSSGFTLEHLRMLVNHAWLLTGEKEGRLVDLKTSEDCLAALQDCLRRVKDSDDSTALNPALAAPLTTISRTFPGLDPARFRHGPDYHDCTWNGERYTFTKTQAACVKILCEERVKGTLELSQQYLLVEAESDSQRLKDIFKGSTAWKTMIVQGSKQGTYRLAEPK